MRNVLLLRKSRLKVDNRWMNFGIKVRSKIDQNLNFSSSMKLDQILTKVQNKTENYSVYKY